MHHIYFYWHRNLQRAIHKQMVQDYNRMNTIYCVIAPRQSTTYSDIVFYSKPTFDGFREMNKRLEHVSIF
jgi:hypothetical protein